VFDNLYVVNELTDWTREYTVDDFAHLPKPQNGKKPAPKPKPKPSGNDTGPRPVPADIMAIVSKRAERKIRHGYQHQQQEAIKRLNAG